MVDVPCGTCHLCCKINVILLEGEERLYRAERWVHNGVDQGWALERRDNGDCIYLAEHGCTIHGRAPMLCQKFDCRELVQKTSRQQRRQAVRHGEMPQEIFERGQELLSK